MTTPNRRPRKFKPPGSWDGPPSPTGWGAPQWANNNDGWGSPAPMSRPQPGPHVCNCSVLKHTSKTKVADNSAQPSDSDEEQEEPQQPFDGIVDRKEHYLIREQIWYEWIQQWVPYDSSRYEVPVIDQDLGTYFYVNIRHQLPGDEGELVLTNFSETLLKFLRTSYGDQFYDDIPERTVDSLLSEIPILQEKLAAIALHLSEKPIESSMVDKRDLAVSLGCQEAKNETHPESHLDGFLTDAQEHISVLTAYLLELYKAKAEKLALQLADGCIEFDLLIFYFELNHRYCLDWGNMNLATGFKLENRAYKYFNKLKSSLTLSGSGYEWNGYSYSRIPVSHSISSYHGTRDLASFDCQPLTPEVETALTARGRLYTALAGCQYRSWRKDRIIVDRLGSDMQDDVREMNAENLDFPDEDLWLLPGTVYGFNLTQKIWTTFPVLEVGPVAFDENAWDHLVLDPETKVLIKSLVQVTRNSNTGSTIINDVITGKGGGLICVLHGPPGTGKTLTAEAVAEHLKRPLYIVGASELSTTPSVLEEKLKSILSLATAWDAVLLIDEADVFLEQRSLHEIERNSLVSVALRILEYHRGVLFLTTNRIKTFDVAFLSRFSIAIKYPEHDLNSRRVIWRKFFELAGVKTGDNEGSGRSTPTDMVKLDDPTTVATMTDAELDELAEKPFNGRTIKNLVRTAQALALSSGVPMSKTHVDVVVRSQEKFLREFAA
ncbi:P-loop containing nucleoside triphosphate hydrolase protein [Mycena albidolilacea]|uniref:P-loop containing nucleoside triphosphate hydrolase protein n=1 Tax=Mycena albidolilacea TaxID=1033008 RepID=A0AAD7EKR6_9AGAR|nr:P-loop containing nucleoside triphosphate hydrolase protein [Mycena albidolilacea]